MPASLLAAQQPEEKAVATMRIAHDVTVSPASGHERVFAAPSDEGWATVTFSGRAGVSSSC